MKNRKIILISLIALALSVSAYLLVNRGGAVNKTLILEPQASEANGVTFKATPLDFNLQNPIKFEIVIDTHSGSLDFDLSEISILEDDLGNQYKPLSWQGSAPGGHHMSGILSFPKINNPAAKMKLTIAQQIFEWQIGGRH